MFFAQSNFSQGFFPLAPNRAQKKGFEYCTKSYLRIHGVKDYIT